VTTRDGTHGEVVPSVRTARAHAFASRFSSPAESPGFLLWKAANLHQRLQRQALADLGISPTQFSLLASYFFLSSTHQRPVSQAELAQHAALDKMLVSDGTRALLGRRLIVRRRSRTDGRAFAIDLTEQGVAVCNRALRVIEETDAAFFARTGDVPVFVDLVAKLLTDPSAGD
jgi:DNA-binding MarR family transcriptional regulator